MAFQSTSSGFLTNLDALFAAKYSFGVVGIDLGYNFYGFFLGSTVESYQSIYLKATFAF